MTNPPIKWFRVTKKEPCLICGKPDWCTRSSSLGSCCMRIANSHPTRNGGWLYRATDKVPVQLHASPEPTINAAKMIKVWQTTTDELAMHGFANELGVTVQSLLDLGCCRSPTHHCWAFPMRDGASQIIGIRLRYDNGEKRSVRGSRSGIFIPMIPPQHTCFVTEGATDCAAALSLGLFSIGRPSCSGGTTQLWLAMKERRISRAVLIADNDPDKFRPDGQRYNPGLDGAMRLADDLNIPTCTLVPPAKDLRMCMSLGMTAELLHSMIKNLIWTMPKRATV